MDDLASVIRWAGVVVALVASFLAAPEATHSIGKSATQKLRRLLRRPSTRARIYRVGLSGTLAPTGSLTVEAVPLNPRTMEGRLAELERLTATLTDKIRANEQAIATEATNRAAAVEGLSGQLSGETAAIRDRVAEMQRKAIRSDTRALPVVGLGIVLSGVPEALAVYPAVGALAIAAALVALAAALAHYYGKDFDLDA